MGGKQRIILQSCKADVRVKRRDGELRIELLRYNSEVDCLSVDEGGNGSESKSKKFRLLKWEGYVQRLLSINTSDGKKYTFKLKEANPSLAAAANDLPIFWVDLLNESQDLFAGVGLLKNVNIDLIELIRMFAEAAPLMAKYNSDEKTLTYSKSELGSERIHFLADMVGHTIGLDFNKTPFDGEFLGGWSWDFHDWLYAKVENVSVEGDNVFVWMTTDAKTKGKFAKEKVEALNKVNGGYYYVCFYDPFSHGAAGMEKFLPAGMGAFSAQGIKQSLSASIDIDEATLFGPVSVDIGKVTTLTNGRSHVGFEARKARTLSFNAATKTISSVLSNKYIEEMSKTEENNPKYKTRLHVKTKSGASLIAAMDNLEKDSALLWEGEALLPVNFSSDDIVGAFLSSGSDTIFPVEAF